MLVTEQLLVPIDFHGMNKMATSIYLVTNIQHILFCVQQKKEIDLSQLDSQ